MLEVFTVVVLWMVGLGSDSQMGSKQIEKLMDFEAFDFQLSVSSLEEGLSIMAPNCGLFWDRKFSPSKKT